MGHKIKHLSQKRCPCCKETKDVSEFPVCRVNKSGIYSWCKTCSAEKTAKRYKANPTYLREAGKARHARLMNESPEYASKHNADSKKWREENPERHFKNLIHGQDMRRARVFNAEGSYTIQEWEDLQTEYGGRCAYCGKEGKLGIDHVVPLSKGGTNSIENIVPACKECNYAKQSTNLLVWMWRKLNNPKVEVYHASR